LDEKPLDEKVTEVGIQEDRILELYTAYFSRVADKDGFNFWKKSFKVYFSDAIASATEAEKENYALQRITTDMATSTEYLDLYSSSLSASDFINAIYANLLGRKSDTEGLNFWSGHINAKTMSKEQAILNIIVGAKTNSTNQGLIDKGLIINKTNLSKYFAETLASNNLELAKTAFSSVTNDPETLVVAKAMLDSALK